MNIPRLSRYLFSGLAFFCVFGADVWAAGLPLKLIKLPPGFKIEVYAEGLTNARSMALGPGGTLFVGSRSAGNVYAVVDMDKDNRADKIYTIGKKLWAPNGVAVKDGALYVAEINRVLRYDDIESNLEKPPQSVVVRGDFPRNTWHGWKVIHFGPDGLLYIPVGAPCNSCEQEDLRYASMLRMNPDGGNLKLFAKGIRNTVGFDWHPTTGELWFTDNGRDNLGDNIPPDELNHAPRGGLHFGFPYCHGPGIRDPELGNKPCEQFTPPAQNLGPHVAALGMKFYTGTMFPEKYRNQIFIAEHGSWNRSQKIGYRVMLVTLKENKPVSYEPFAEGWNEGEAVWGRPVDCLVMPDGALLVSDDHANVIYRISYSPE